jgi:hypothetical protein
MPYDFSGLHDQLLKICTIASRTSSHFHEVNPHPAASYDSLPAKRFNHLPRRGISHRQRFTAYSREAAGPDNALRSQFVIMSPVTRESVQIFINTCQGKSSPYDVSQILDLLLLSKEWPVDSLKDHLFSSIENDDDRILACLRYASENGFETDQYEGRARRRFSGIVDKDELLELTIPVLRRIVDVGLQDTDFDKLSGFLTKCLDRFGNSASVLFQGVDLRHFSVTQLQELKDRRDFLWCYLSDGVCDTISLCISEMGRHRTLFEEEHAALCDLQREYARVNSECQAAHAVRVDLQSRLSLAESSLASMERRLVLLESSFVSRSDLERSYAKPSDLARTYVTKSELQRDYTNNLSLKANYVKRLKLGKYYGKKSEPETDYARKGDLETELQAGYLTTADARSLEQRCASKTEVEKELKFLKRVTRTFLPIPDALLKGIIHHLTEESGGNVHDQGVVTITSGRPYSDDPGFAGKNIADFEANSWFYATNEENMWVCYDFKTMKVTLADYSIRSRWDGPSQNLKSWVIEVSNNYRDWTEADRRENRDDLCNVNVIRPFAVSRPSTSRYVRLRQIGRTTTSPGIT